jgi:xanthine/uracil permease
MRIVLSRDSLELAVHFAFIGSLADIALQLHKGQMPEALGHAFIASLCIVLLAAALYLAKKLLGKD